MRDDDDRDDGLEYDEPHSRRPATSGSGGKWIIALVVVVICGVLVLPVAACLIGLMLPAVQKVRSAAQRAATSNNMKEIGMAMHNYADKNNHLPLPYRRTKDGRPGLSWRVEVLPFLSGGQYAGLYQKFKLDEPWDSPANSALMGQMPAAYGQPGETGGTVTHFRVFVGNGAIFEPAQKIRFADIQDGSSNTILAVETTDAVPWTKPDELDYRPGAPLPALGLPQRDTVTVLMADGSVRSVKKSANLKDWHAAITRAGGEILRPDW